MNTSLAKDLIANLSILRPHIDSRTLEHSENLQNYSLRQLSLANIAVSVTSAFPLTKVIGNHIQRGNFQFVYILPNVMSILYIRQSECPFSAFHHDAALHQEVQPYHRY